MARRQVVEVTCDRCNRTETQNTSTEPMRSESGKELTLAFNGKVVEYEDLCTRCRGAVEGYANQITKDAKPKPKIEKPVKKPGLLSRVAG